MLLCICPVGWLSLAGSTLIFISMSLLLNQKVSMIWNSMNSVTLSPTETHQQLIFFPYHKKTSRLVAWLTTYTKGFNNGKNTDDFWQVTVIIGHSASMSSFYARSTSTNNYKSGNRVSSSSLLLSQIWLSLSATT